MTAEEQDRYLLDVLDALEQANKSSAVEIPKEVCENDDSFLDWLLSLQ